MLVLDPRLDQVKKVVEALVTKSLLYSTNCLVTSNNNLIIVVDDTLLYVIPLKNESLYPTLGFSYSKLMEFCVDREIDFSKEYLDIYDSIITNKLSLLYNNYSTTINLAPMVAYNDDLKSTENFTEFLNIKADDGMKYYKLPGLNPGSIYHIAVFTGFPNISAQDKLAIYVHDTFDGFLIVKYKIFKKKINRDVEIIFRILKLT